MGASGIVRRVDDLGRIVIPREMRQSLKIRKGDSLEVFFDNDVVSLKKHSPVSNLESIAEVYVESIYNVIKDNVIITDSDKIIAAAGRGNKKYLGQPISSYLENVIRKREDVIEYNRKKLEIIANVDEIASYIIIPINTTGDLIGLVIIYSNEHDINDLEIKIGNIASNFLGNHVG